MKHLKIDPDKFDGAKFALRYGLDALEHEFYVAHNTLYFPDTLPDQPTIDPPDPVDPDAPRNLAEALARTLLAKGGIKREDLGDFASRLPPVKISPSIPSKKEMTHGI